MFLKSLYIASLVALAKGAQLLNIEEYLETTISSNSEGCGLDPFIPTGGNYTEYVGYSGVNGMDLECGDFKSQEEI